LCNVRRPGRASHKAGGEPLRNHDLPTAEAQDPAAGKLTVDNRDLHR